MQEKYNIINLEVYDKSETVVIYETEKLKELSAEFKKLRKNLRNLEQTIKMNPVFEKELQLWNNNHRNLNDLRLIPPFHDLLDKYDEYIKEYRSLREKLIIYLADEVKEIESSVLKNLSNPKKINQLKYPPSYQKIFEAMLEDYRVKNQETIKEKKLALENIISNYQESKLGNNKYVTCTGTLCEENGEECSSPNCFCFSCLTCGLPTLIEAALKGIATAINKCATYTLETQIEYTESEKDKDISELESNFILFKQMKESINQDLRAKLRYQFFKTAKVCHTSPLINEEQLNESISLNDTTNYF